MQQLGVGWAPRRLASSMGYGAGKVIQTIAHTSERFHLSQTGGRVCFDQLIVPQGGPQRIRRRADSGGGGD